MIPGATQHTKLSVGMQLGSKRKVRVGFMLFPGGTANAGPCHSKGSPHLQAMRRSTPGLSSSKLTLISAVCTCLAPQAQTSHVNPEKSEGVAWPRKKDLPHMITYSRLVAYASQLLITGTEETSNASHDLAQQCCDGL